MRCHSFLVLGLLASCASPSRVQIAERDISLTVPQGIFTGVGVKVLEKHVDVPGEIPFDVGPRRWVVMLSHAPRTSMKLKEPRYYFPATSRIFVTPLADASVSDFEIAYPGWLKNAARLRRLLANPRGADLASVLPDEPWNNAGRALEAKIRRIDGAALSGYRLLCYYRQGRAGYGATNAELTYCFQGLTKDGRYYVSARLAVRNDRLPDSMGDPRAKSDEIEVEAIAERKRINSWSDESFSPELRALDEMIASIRVK